MESVFIQTLEAWIDSNSIEYQALKAVVREMNSSRLGRSESPELSLILTTLSKTSQIASNFVFSG